MRIRVFKSGDGWRADPQDLPGTPPNGIGRTAFEAIGDLFWRVECEIEIWGKHGWPEFTINMEGFGTPQQWLDDCVSGRRKDNQPMEARN